MYKGSNLSGDNIVNAAKLELAQGRDEATEATEVNQGEDTATEADAIEKASVAHPAEDEGGLQAEDVIELEEVLVGAEVEEHLEGLEGKCLVDDQVREDVVVEPVEGGEVGEVQVLEGKVVDAEDIEAIAELDTRVELVEAAEREVSLLLRRLLRSGGRGRKGGESADEDTGELHFDGEESVLWIKKLERNK